MFGRGPQSTRTPNCSLAGLSATARPIARCALSMILGRGWPIAFSSPAMGIGLILQAVDTVFGDDVDYAMLHKIYGADPAARGAIARRFASARKSAELPASPIAKHVSTSFAERAESYDADAHAPLHSIDQCIFKENRKPRCCGRAAYDVLQFRAGASDLESQRPQWPLA